MKNNENLKNQIEDAFNSSQIPELEKNAIIRKLEKALDSNLINESDMPQVLEIKNDLSSAKNESQVLKVLARLIELLIVLTKSFLE